MARLARRMGLKLMVGNMGGTGLAMAPDDVTYFAQIRGGGLDLVKWKLPHSHDQTMNEATTDERRYTGSAGSAAR